MAHVLVIGAGVSGCTVAYTLAERDINVTLIEKASAIGGKVRTYGCKAVDGKCQNCGVCLTAGLWDKVSNHRNIRVLTDAVIKDITGGPGDFSVKVIDDSGDVQRFDSIGAIVVSSGFENLTHVTSNHLHIEGTSGLLNGAQIEKLMLERTLTDVFEKPPDSIAFIQCLGSRDKNEGGLYCSRVCCSYSTRAAKVIRSYYPECKIVFFYMELQNVEAGNYHSGLRELGMEFIKCRPLRVVGGAPVTVEYDDFTNGNSIGVAQGIRSMAFDLVVLSDGIHAPSENDFLAEIFKLSRDKDGFLNSVGSDLGIYVTGCARAPMKIDEAYADSVATAGMILASALEYDTGAAYALHRR